VDIPVDIKPQKRGPSLYRDLFGDDLSVIAEAYGAPWASHDHHTLASQILDGQKDINSLSTQDTSLLDDMAVRFSGYTPSQAEPVQQALKPVERAKEEADRQESEDAPAQSITDAYGWLEGGDSDEE
jgi:hypothetical protein